MEPWIRLYELLIAVLKEDEVMLELSPEDISLSFPPKIVALLV